MADVFISYRKADRARAQALANALKIENLDVWWDTALETGQTFDEKIQAVLEKCKAVIVLWSKESVKSDWVRAESSIGRERGILVPVMIQPVNIPVPFNLLHTADLIGWSGDRAHPGYRDVVKQVKELAGKTSVKPLKPPPNRALRALWRTVTAVGILAAIGASLWVFRPWETFVPKDPVVEAKREAEEKRTASLNSLAAYGLQPGDLDRHGSQHIVDRIFRKETRDQLNAEAAKGDPALLTLKCAVDLWTLKDDTPDYEAADPTCEKAAESGEPAGRVFFGDMLMEASYYSSVNDSTRASFKTGAISQYSQAAAAGSALGETSYGRALMEGKDVPLDLIKAEALFKSAQAKGLPLADFLLGSLYLLGDIQGPEYDQAVAMIRKAADANVQEAQSYMADHLMSPFGDATRVALEEALVYRQACTTGIDSYIAFRCRESIPPLEERIADAKAAEAAAPN